LKRALRAALMSAALGLGAALFALTPAGTAFEEQVGLTWLFTVRGPVPAPPQVAIVALDKRSSDYFDVPEYPRPWPRSLHAELIDALVRRGASVIVLDIAFETAQSVNEDQALASAIARADRVVLFEALERTRQRLVDDAGRAAGWVWLDELRLPLPAFAEGAVAVAPFPLPIVPTRVVQFWKFLDSHAAKPTLPAVALLAYARPVAPLWSALLAEAGLPTIGRTHLPRRLPARKANLTDAGRILRLAIEANPAFADRLRQTFAGWQADGLLSAMPSADAALLESLVALFTGAPSQYLRYYGPPGTVRTIPYDRVIEEARAAGPAVANDLAGTCIFVGYSELSVASKVDGFRTVFSSDEGIDLSGVEMAATTFANLLTNRPLRLVAPELTLALFVAFGLALGMLVFRLPAGFAVPAVLAAGATYAAAAQLVFNHLDLWLPVATPLLLLPLVLVLGLLAQYLLVGRQRRQVQNALSYYVPDRVAQGFADQSVNPIAVREIAHATCLATDAESFTTVSERLSPQATATLLNAYFAALTQPLQQYRADFIEYHADGVMCAWVTGDDDAAHRERACLAAIAAVEAIERFNAERSTPRLGVRIGLHAGDVFLGHVGAGGKFAFRLVGDIVNTASRIEGLNKHCGTRLLASEGVVADVRSILVRPLGDFRLKGKEAAVAVFEILGVVDRVGPRQRALSLRFTQALAAFRRQQWQQAAQQFEAILEDYPEDGPSRFYRDCSHANLNVARTDAEGGVITLLTK
jgi:adenylate cyclase